MKKLKKPKKLRIRRPLPDSAFVVLALIAEGETHGYNIQKMVHDRGFQFWTNLKRSSTYNALSLLEKEGLISSETAAGEGPDRKVYSITAVGKRRLAEEGATHLATPAPPKSEIDLGLYVLPFLPASATPEVMAQCLSHLEQRRDFLRERLNWCQSHDLYVPALAFERPLLLLETEIRWLKKVAKDLEGSRPLRKEDWQKYEYRRPPDLNPDQD
ncbi:MAG: PadR family transcriptional regulator [Bdellovibrionales bacterium]